MLVGLVRIRGHCLFTWREPVGAERCVEILPDHCAECIAEVRRLGFLLIRPSADQEIGKDRERPNAP
jgi:hypothetical protein